MMMYLWTAPGSDETAQRHASGVTDSAVAARHAAESLLRTGQAGSAYIECAYTAVGVPALSLCYVRTGTGWSGHVGQAGQVVWTPFPRPESAPRVHEGIGHRGDALTTPGQAEAVSGGRGQAHGHHPGRPRIQG